MNNTQYNINDYIGKSDGRLLTKKAVSSGFYDYLLSKYPWSKSFKELVYYKQNGITIQKQCSYVNCQNKISFNLKFCCTSCGAKQQIIDGNNMFSNKTLNAGKIPWNKGVSTVQYHAKHTNPDAWEAAKRKISKANSGENNGSFGRVKTEEELIKQRTSIINSIASGLYTPKSNNRNTHWDSFYKDIKFRSSWEAAFYSINPYINFEDLRIKYSNTTNKTRVYITDFVDHIHKVVYEIKPVELFDICNDKHKAAIQWCNDNGYNFVHIGIEYLYNNKDKINNLDENSIRKLNNAFKKYERNRKAESGI